MKNGERDSVFDRISGAGWFPMYGTTQPNGTRQSTYTQCRNSYVNKITESERKAFKQYYLVCCKYIKWHLLFMTKEIKKSKRMHDSHSSMGSNVVMLMVAIWWQNRVNAFCVCVSVSSSLAPQEPSHSSWYNPPIHLNRWSKILQ